MTHSSIRLSRRAALQVGCLGGLGLSLADYLAWTAPARGEEAAPPIKPTADAVIFIHLQGGPSHLDTLDMKPAAPAEEKGEFQPIASKFSGLPVCEHLPEAGRRHRPLDARPRHQPFGRGPSAGQPIPVHRQPVSPAVTHPALGSVAIKERPCPPELPGFVAIPSSEVTPGYLGVSYSAFKTGEVPKPGQPFQVRGLSLPAGLTVEKMSRREGLLEDLDTVFRQADANSDVLDGLDRFGKQAQEMILSERTRTAFDTSQEPASIAGLFAADDFSQSLLLALRLVEYGVRFVTVNFEARGTRIPTTSPR